MKRRKIQIDNGFGVEDKIVSEIKLDDNKDYDEMPFDFIVSYLKFTIGRLMDGFIIFTFLILLISLLDMLPKMSTTIHQKMISDIFHSEFTGLEQDFLRYEPIITVIMNDNVISDDEFDILISIMNNDENLNLINKLVIFEVIKKSESSEYVKNHIEKTIKIIEGDNDDE
ncbi:hypothetical protein CO725_00790 [Vibrio parahaemolyticus]|uniref:hypothetical protein n=1 Tax=Vibrio parahaemolyticus TaxID=670 RepID=UPI000BE3D980|nr:hypothetical protein [Vibrio parahaemolyticus]ATI44222.1 hypothetical protein CO725_00790 [Vibrio parahaemolyticus]